MVFQKSLTRELTFTAVSVFVVLLAILVTTQTINLLGRAAEGRIANEAVAALIGFWTLGLFPLLLILTVFISVLVVLTRLWRDHEMAVWLASGVSLKDWVKPVLRFAVPLAILVGISSLLIGPWAEQRSHEYAEILKQHEDVSAISPGIFKESHSSRRVYFVENFSGKNGSAANIFMQDMSKGKVASIFAKSGRIVTNEQGERLLVLENGRRYVGNPGEADYEVAEFARYSVVINDQPQFIPSGNSRQTMTSAALALSDKAGDKAELGWRLSMPISTVVLALLAIPLSYFNPRSGHTYNLLLALLAYFVYQNALTLCRNWVLQDRLSAYAMLAPHMLMLLVALGMLTYRNRPASSPGRFLGQLIRKS
ncbi:permease, YjgP/YjgQ family [Pseudogulbenkiania sp. NH8B]|uniref:LPS export ABC transporter permease LptF n=1 Tax=Pseudogulbenkiania sp. (strain NH8B) TaxID=748280 RepID=UPI0002279CEE|nr:LPS export ABC transporter permease LptF [Pseudogulbenkiania sp. NH8B]BAK76541.1 permease, YjgP/YjgQ family [Pseudogulbenkiania sp. NH8B]